MSDDIPRWRLWFSPPHWFRLTFALGPFEAARICADKDHPAHCISAMDKPIPRSRYLAWTRSMTRAQYKRYLWGLPMSRPKFRPEFPQPLEWDLEAERAHLERQDMNEWSRRTGLDPIFSPTFQARLERVRRKLDSQDGLD